MNSPLQGEISKWKKKVGRRALPPLSVAHTKSVSCSLVGSSPSKLRTPLSQRSTWDGGRGASVPSSHVHDLSPPGSTTAAPNLDMSHFSSSTLDTPHDRGLASWLARPCSGPARPVMPAAKER